MLPSRPFPCHPGCPMTRRFLRRSRWYHPEWPRGAAVAAQRTPFGYTPRRHPPKTGFLGACTRPYTRTLGKRRSRCSSAPLSPRACRPSRPQACRRWSPQRCERATRRGCQPPGLRSVGSSARGASLRRPPSAASACCRSRASEAAGRPLGGGGAPRIVAPKTAPAAAGDDTSSWRSTFDL